MKKEYLPSLSEATEVAIAYFARNKPCLLIKKDFNFPLVVGSGNAFNTGQIIFNNQKAIFANESNFKEIVKNYKDLIKNKIITEAVIISASGEKDSIWELKLAKKIGLKTHLFTCSPESTSANIAETVHLFKKLPEPYTYNISTYLGMILSATKENPKTIQDTLKKIKIKNEFKNYNSFAFILPDRFAALAPMLEIKRNELFGPKLCLRAFTEGDARHAKFVIRDEKELVISFDKNSYFGHPNSRWQIKLPKNIDYGSMMVITYFLTGKIQENKTPWFNQNIYNFCNKYGWQPYGGKKPFDVIVK